MKLMLFTAFILLALTACSTTPPPPPPPGLWYAERELPDDFRYHVYVHFRDDGTFQYWRTKEDQETVLRKMHYYLNEHPGWDIPTPYTRDGDRIEGKRTIARDRYTSIQAFTGQFSDNSLDMTITSYWITKETGPNPPPTTKYQWKLKRLGN